MNIANTIAIVLVAITGIMNASHISNQTQRIDETQAEIQLLQGKVIRLEMIARELTK